MSRSGPRVSSLERLLADAPCTVDLRTGTPPELADRLLPERAPIVVSNPCVPHDRRFLEGATAMACHPQGGLVVQATSMRYAPSAERGRRREYVANGDGLWRIETDGCVSTVYGNGKCPPIDGVRRQGHLTPAFDRVVVDRPGRPVVIGADRARREGSGPGVVYTKVHRIEAGLVVPENTPRLRYWWRSAPQRPGNAGAGARGAGPAQFGCAIQSPRVSRRWVFGVARQAVAGARP